MTNWEILFDKLVRKRIMTRLKKKKVYKWTIQRRGNANDYKDSQSLS